MDNLLDRRFRSIIDFLGLDRSEIEERHIPEKVMFLYDWAEFRSRSDDMGKVLKEISKLKQQIGSTLRGKPLLVDMYKWARLDSTKLLKEHQEEISQIEQKEKAKEKRQSKRSGQEKIEVWEKTKLELKKEAESNQKLAEKKANILQRVIENKSEKEVKTNIRVSVSKEPLPDPEEIKL